MVFAGCGSDACQDDAGCESGYRCADPGGIFFAKSVCILASALPDAGPDSGGPDSGGPDSDANADVSHDIVDTEDAGDDVFEAGCTGGSCPTHCDDGLLNGDETDIDCGGGLCEPCADEQKCSTHADCASASCFFGVCTPDRCGYAWTPISSTRQPSGRRGHQMAYDARRERVVLFGGNDGLLLADTWEWDGKDWTLVANSGPPARFNHAMAYDPVLERVVLFGGESTELHGDTWLWDGERWTSAPIAPEPRRNAALVYDAESGGVILFGGIGGDDDVVYGDTWLLAAGSWSQVSNSGPSPRWNHAMAADSARDQIVLFGGSDLNTAYADTWQWGRAGWTPRAIAGPPARASAAMAFDPTLGQSVLFGGFSSVRLGDSWIYDGVDWKESAGASPSPRSQMSMVYDAARRHTLLFGGWNGSQIFRETWAFVPRADCP